MSAIYSIAFYDQDNNYISRALTELEQSDIEAKSGEVNEKVHWVLEVADISEWRSA